MLRSLSIMQKSWSEIYHQPLTKHRDTYLIKQRKYNYNGKFDYSNKNLFHQLDTKIRIGIYTKQCVQTPRIKLHCSQALKLTYHYNRSLKNYKSALPLHGKNFFVFLLSYHTKNLSICYPSLYRQWDRQLHPCWNTP